MKKSVILKVIILSSLFLYSCSNNPSLKVSYQDSDTLKDILKEKEEDTRWSQELEGDRLNKNIEIENKIVARDVKKDNQVLKILKGYQNPVFAKIEDFGNLDSSVLTKNQITFVNDFLKFVSTKTYADVKEYFIPEYTFNYQFFIQDLRIELYEYKDKFETLSKDKEADINLFDKWIIGEPVKYENQILIPVRVYTEKKYLNLLLSSTNDAALKLYNVEIEKVGELNGN